MSNLTDDVRHHVVPAFLCPINREATMIEHNCDEHGLFENPKWLLEHYFEKSGVQINDEDKKIIFDFLETGNGKQIMESFLCPVNRYCTKEEYSCSDEDFMQDKNYERLIKHYIFNGGAVAFAQRRNRVTI